MSKNETMLPIMSVDISKIEVDYSYQRPLNLARVSEMVRNYSATLVRLPVVSIRKDGRIFAIDGNHTIAVQKGIGTTGKINVHYHIGLTVEQEAHEFIRLNENGWNGRLQVSACSKFDAAVTARHSNAVEIKSIAKSLGLDVGTKARAIRAIEALGYAHSNGNLKKTLWTLNTWCPEDSHRFENALIRGMSAFYSRYQHADEKHLVRALTDSNLAPSELKARFNRQKKTYGPGDSYRGQVEAILEIYNKGLKGSKRL